VKIACLYRVQLDALLHAVSYDVLPRQRGIAMEECTCGRMYIMYILPHVAM